MKILPTHFDLIDGLPGAELIEIGLTHLGEDTFDTPEALLTLMGVPRMIPGGFDCLREIPASRFEELEARLYAALGKNNPQRAYGEYNAMRSRLGSFLGSLEARCRREREHPKR